MQMTKLKVHAFYKSLLIKREEISKKKICVYTKCKSFYFHILHFYLYFLFSPSHYFISCYLESHALPLLTHVSMFHVS